MALSAPLSVQDGRVNWHGAAPASQRQQDGIWHFDCPQCLLDNHVPEAKLARIIAGVIAAGWSELPASLASKHMRR